MARYSFLVTDGPDQQRTFDLEIGITLIGRRDTPADDDPEGSARWVLTDPAVSRTHARIDWDGKKPPVLLHLSSTNATLLDGRIVTGQSMEDGQSLRAGQHLRMGQTGFEIQVESDDSRWYVENRGENEIRDLSPGESWHVHGISLNCEGAVVEVALVDAEAEAYLLRNIDSQLWTTSLRRDKPVVLKSADVIRTETGKFVLRDRESR
jgi:hypothetical protein